MTACCLMNGCHLNKALPLTDEKKKEEVDRFAWIPPISKEWLMSTMHLEGDSFANCGGERVKRKTNETNM